MYLNSTYLNENEIYFRQSEMVGVIEKVTLSRQF
jgi:hypothetical protein